MVMNAKDGDLEVVCCMQRWAKALVVSYSFLKINTGVT